MQSIRPLISVVIPHLNQPAGLRSCLLSLEAQTLGAESFEVIVVDNGSVSLPQLGNRNFSIQLLQELTPGPGAARNMGAARASGHILAFIDADCRAHRDWLRTALSEIQSAQARTILGGDLQIWRDSPGAFSAIEAYESVFAYRFQLYIEKHGYCGTGNLIVRRPDFYEIGLFKGIRFPEDLEWGQRARAAGFRFRYVPGMIVYHPARKTLKELFVKWNRLSHHSLNMAREQRSWRVKWLGRAIAILLSPAFDWTKVVASDRLHGTSARLKAIAVLIVTRTYRFANMIRLLFSSEGIIWNRSRAIEIGDPQDVFSIAAGEAKQHLQVEAPLLPVVARPKRKLAVAEGQS